MTPRSLGYNPAHDSIFECAKHAIPWASILQWIEDYGLPLVLNVLPLILPQVAGLSTAQIVMWIEAALAASQQGQPLPPVPMFTP